MAAPCFGFSVGDFISAIQLVAQVTDALKASSSATTECQNAVVFLETVKYTLRRVLDTGTSSADVEACQQLRTCAQACCEQVVRFSQRVQKYEASFSTSQTTQQNLRQKWRRGSSKVKWSLAVKEDLAELMTAVTPQLCVMQLFLQLQEASSARQWQVDILQTTRSTRAQMERLVATLEPDAVAGAEINSDSNFSMEPTALARRRQRPKIAARHDVWTEMTTFDASILQKMHNGIARLFLLFCLYAWQWIHRYLHAFTTMPQTLSMLLDTNITLTDALGRTLSLPHEHFSDWTMIMARLKVSFRDCTGEPKVRRGDFVIFHLQGRREMLHEGNWANDVLPGSKVIMAMVIGGQGYGVSDCPRCGSYSNRPDQAGWTTCDQCELRHRLSGPNSPISTFQEDDYPIDDPVGRFTFGKEPNLHAQEERSELQTYKIVEDDHPIDDPVGRFISAKELDLQAQEERSELQDYKLVYWTTAPCNYCDAVFTTEEALLEHLGCTHLEKFI